MTKREIAELFGYCEEYIHKIFRDAAKTDDLLSKNLKAKNNHSTKMNTIDYSLDECIYACRRVFNPMQMQYLRENFIYRSEMYKSKYKKKKIAISDKAKKFLWVYIKANGKRCVCATCTYLIARKPNMNGRRFTPYCNLYNRFIYRTKIDIYNNRCPSYEWSNKPPLIFNKSGIANIDIFGNVEKTTLGINNSTFTTGKTTGNEISILRELKFTSISRDNA